MSCWLPVVLTLFLSSASGQFDNALNSFPGTITKEVAAVKDPIDKTVTYIGFSQCKHVKKIIGVDYDQYRDEPNLSKLTLDFITREIKVQFNVSALSEIASSQWFKPENGLIIYMHGFTEDPHKSSYTNMHQAFLAKGNFNILALDSSSLIRWLYLRSSTMVRFIGHALGSALATMVQAGLDPSSIHLIGHSLGSHIASFTGKTLHNLTGYKVGRISGLDPAGPCFADVDPELRLTKTDADYVDVMHTDAGVYGLNAIVGHRDYYPNSGSEQYGCLLQTCSHSRAWLYFAESVVNHTAFPAVSCDSWKAFKNGQCDYNDVSYMGFASERGTGLYFLQTSDEKPFGLGMNGIRFTNKEGVVKNIFGKLGF